MRHTVAILGGGVAGMSAAHELCERGFEVTVYEKGRIPGGKARSVAASPAGMRRPPLPGEHGFRFFPGFYRHVIDTMKRIPGRHGSVADSLVATTEVQLAREGRPPINYPARFPQSPAEVLTAINFAIGLVGRQLDIGPEELAFFAGKMIQIVTSCQERRIGEYELVDWWDFVGADERSPGYQRFFANAFTRSLVAAKAERASSRTIGDIFMQMVLSAVTPGEAADRVLDGPTNDVWLDPWLAHLRARGVRYHQGAEVRSINCRHGRVQSATIAHCGRLLEVEADHFIAAVPLERLIQLSRVSRSRLAEADPKMFQDLEELSACVEWMSGIQFYLREDRPLVHGHSIHMDSPWALTSISQAQFWPDHRLPEHGDGQVRGILSVCISDWDVPGGNGKRADQCTAAEVKDETWRQLKRSLESAGCELPDEILHSWFLDPGIVDSDPRRPGPELNAEPLLVNYYDTWRVRPTVETALPNLFLASDYVRTFTDIATMEAANEAARRAVNAVIAATRAPVDACPVWNLHEPEIFAPFRARDRERYVAGLPWDDRLTAGLDLVARGGEALTTLGRGAVA
jgi:uncharacterized protein with NAD-binding domain and iron-sulfur cluster